MFLSGPDLCHVVHGSSRVLSPSVRPSLRPPLPSSLPTSFPFSKSSLFLKPLYSFKVLQAPHRIISNMKDYPTSSFDHGSYVKVSLLIKLIPEGNFVAAHLPNHPTCCLFLWRGQPTDQRKDSARV